ncbi:hypothetical protein K2173_018914 [Erythroxylum novogranatense]|uniref:ApaG domain-containing protein n=1 Tax=Erythroxylum novogranatense TaxID=1862640 RepID=A0AAV8SSZ0_9ROSI|nr:hypothetical protein K2173_018914 [Erythroxylum novogranatense]
MGLEAVGDLALRHILTKLGGKDTARLACLNKRFLACTEDETLWSLFCLEDLGLRSPIDPQGSTVPSFKAAYKLWMEAFGMYPWPLVKRVKRCWDRIRSWLATNFPEVDSSLRKGASEAQIEELEKLFKVKLPVATRILYRFCDGQDFRGKAPPSSEYRSLLGLIGGYFVYDHLVNVYLLPLRKVISETREIIRHPGFSGFSSKNKYILVAASSTLSKKFFFLNCTNGQLYVATGNLLMDGDMLPCVPSALICSVHDLKSDNQQDAMLLWLEEHGRRLQSGAIKIREEVSVRSICQFPEEPPLCSTAVTNGVKVRASSVFMPELANLQSSSQKYCFAYSIRMSLLPEGCIINGQHFSSCQLHWRHWIIRADDDVIDDVDAEAVIGKYPLLHPGEKEFVYQSCSHLPTATGSIEGSFRFVPGRLADPKGSAFEVEVHQFPLQLPDYIF